MRVVGKGAREVGARAERNGGGGGGRKVERGMVWVKVSNDTQRNAHRMVGLADVVFR